MHLQYVIALLFTTTSLTLAAPFESKHTAITSPKLTLAGESLSHPRSDEITARGAKGSVKVCVKQWLKDHNDACLDECIQAALHDQAFGF